MDSSRYKQLHNQLNSNCVIKVPLPGAYVNKVPDRTYTINVSVSYLRYRFLRYQYLRINVPVLT
jgi:hypothetical protein